MTYCKEMKVLALKKYGRVLEDGDTITFIMYDNEMAKYCPFCGQKIANDNGGKG